MTITEIRYGSGSVNHEKVRAAMAEVGAQLEAERLQRVADEHAEVLARGGRICGGTDHRLNVPCEWAAAVEHDGHRCWWHAADLADDNSAPPSRHVYGPHRDEDSPTTVEILPRGKWPQPVLAPIPPAITRQRQQINAHAHRHTTQEEPHVRSVRS